LVSAMTGYQTSPPVFIPWKRERGKEEGDGGGKVEGERNVS